MSEDRKRLTPEREAEIRKRAKHPTGPSSGALGVFEDAAWSAAADLLAELDAVRRELVEMRPIMLRPVTLPAGSTFIDPSALTAATTRAEVAEREVRTATAVLDETRLRMAPLLAALTAAQADLSSARGTGETTGALEAPLRAEVAETRRMLGALSNAVSRVAEEHNADPESDACAAAWRALLAANIDPDHLRQAADGWDAKRTREVEARVLREMADTIERNDGGPPLCDGMDWKEVAREVSDWLRAEADKRDGTAGETP